MTIKEFANTYNYEIIVSRENLAMTNKWDHSKNLEYHSAILANIDMGARWINHDELINYPLERLFDKSVFYKTAAYTKEHPEILRQLYYALGEELFNHSEIFTMENQKNNECFLGAENYNNDPRNFYTPSKSSSSSSSSSSSRSSSSGRGCTTPINGDYRNGYIGTCCPSGSGSLNSAEESAVSRFMSYWGCSREYALDELQHGHIPTKYFD